MPIIGNQLKLSYGVIEDANVVKYLTGRENPIVILDNAVADVIARKKDWFRFVWMLGDLIKVYESEKGWFTRPVISDEWNGKTTGLFEGSGVVNVFYNNTLLGSLSESGSAILNTSGKIVRNDITIEYEEPYGELSYRQMTISKMISTARPAITTPLWDDEDGVLELRTFDSTAQINATILVPCASFMIKCNTDNFMYGSNEISIISNSGHIIVPSGTDDFVLRVVESI